MLKASKDSLSYLVFEDEVFQLLRNMETNQTASFIRSKEKKQEEGTVTKSILDDIEIEVVEQEDIRRAYVVTKHFNPKESMYYLQVMNRLLTTIKNTKLAIITEQRQIEWMETFLNLDRKQVELLGSENFEFRVSL